jgi:hypothetical protein
MRESQLRNVVNVAIGATSVEEIAAFILYQMGRSTNSRQWLYGDFGKTVVDDLMRGPVHAAAEAAVQQAMTLMQNVPDVGPVAATDDLLREAHIVLARLYLGYLNRLFYFADRGGHNDQGRWTELTELLPHENGEEQP